MKIVLSIGGSVLAPDGVDLEYVKNIADLLIKLSVKHKLAVVVGGGAPARKAISKARAGGASWAECDYVGVLATRYNANALIRALAGRSNQEIPTSLPEAVVLFGNKILVMGGTEPGHSTDAVAALIAEWVRADLFINASNVDAVYDKNPKEHKDAKPFKEVDIATLLRIVGGGSMEAGKYPLLDLVSARIVERSKIKTIILDARNLKNLEDAIEGRHFKGTTLLF
ncbi:MAG: UMP kinase [Candidatus Altiarchaeota archaeon]